MGVNKIRKMAALKARANAIRTELDKQDTDDGTPPAAPEVCQSEVFPMPVEQAAELALAGDSLPDHRSPQQQNLQPKLREGEKQCSPRIRSMIGSTALSSSSTRGSSTNEVQQLEAVVKTKEATILQLMDENASYRMQLEGLTLADKNRTELLVAEQRGAAELRVALSSEQSVVRELQRSCAGGKSSSEPLTRLLESKDQTIQRLNSEMAQLKERIAYVTTSSEEQLKERTAQILQSSQSKTKRLEDSLASERRKIQDLQETQAAQQQEITRLQKELLSQRGVDEAPKDSVQASQRLDQVENLQALLIAERRQVAQLQDAVAAEANRAGELQQMLMEAHKPSAGGGVQNPAPQQLSEDPIQSSMILWDKLTASSPLNRQLVATQPLHHEAGQQNRAFSSYTAAEPLAATSSSQKCSDAVSKARSGLGAPVSLTQKACSSDSLKPSALSQSQKCLPRYGLGSSASSSQLSTGARFQTQKALSASSSALGAPVSLATPEMRRRDLSPNVNLYSTVRSVTPPLLRVPCAAAAPACSNVSPLRATPVTLGYPNNGLGMPQRSAQTLILQTR